MKDAIVILAGGVNDDGTLPEIPKKRVEKGIELFNSGKAERIIMTGAYGFWLDYYKKVPSKFEATAMKEYAISLGVRDGAVITEEESKDTLGNAYFTKVNFLDKNDWKDIYVVTSDFHIERTKVIFDFVLGPDYKIEYVSAESGMSENGLQEREKREKQTIKTSENLWGHLKMGDSEAIRKVIYTKHPGYADNPEISYEDLLSMLGREE